MNQEKFIRYETIRKSGVTNMFNIRFVIALSDGILTKEDCLDIMQGDNYEKYYNEYIGDIDERGD